MIKVACAILTNHGKIFLARRKPALQLGGMWEFPGGKLENGENLRQCLEREMFEEFGISTLIHDEIGIYAYDFKDKRIELTAYYTEWTGGVMCPVDHDATVWCEPRELLKYKLTPGDVPLARNALEFFLRYPEKLGRHQVVSDI